MDGKGHHLAQPAIGGRAENGARVISAGKRTAIGARAGGLGFTKGIKGLAGTVWRRAHRPAQHHANADAAHPAPVGVGSDRIA